MLICMVLYWCCRFPSMTLASAWILIRQRMAWLIRRRSPQNDLLDSFIPNFRNQAKAYHHHFSILPPGGRKSAQHGIEMYDRKRFCGDWRCAVQLSLTINDRQTHIEHFLHALIFPSKLTKPQHAINAQANNDVPADDKGSQRFLPATTGRRYGAVWRSQKGYDDDDSAADLALCNYLAFWQVATERIDRMFSAKPVIPWQVGPQRTHWRNLRWGNHSKGDSWNCEHV